MEDGRPKSEAFWDPATIERFKKAWLQGISSKDIGSRFSITSNAVMNTAKRFGLPDRPRKGRSRLPLGTP